MKLVVDANVVISALIANSKTRELIVDEQTGNETLAQVPKRAREITALFPEALPRG